jgi:hypothetical protein
MASDSAKQATQTLSSILRFLKIFTLNIWRRLIMVGRYTIICFHQQRLCRAWRLLGKQIHQTVEGGEVNPMLTEEVQDRLARAQAIKETKERHYRAIAALREQIRSSRAVEAPPPPPAEPAPPGDTGPEQPQS